MRLRTIALLLFSACILVCAGCGKAEIEKLKADNESLEKKIQESKDAARAEAQRLKTESESKIKTLADGKEQIAKLLKEKDPKLAETVVALQKAEQESRDAQQKLGEVQRQFNAAKTEKETLLRDKAEAEGIAKDAREKATKADSASKDAIASTEKMKTEAKDAVAKLEKETAGLRKRVREISHSPAALQKPEAFKNSTAIVVGFQPGKQEEAELMCKALGFKIVKAYGADEGNLILCKWTKPVTEETLQILDACRSTIKYVQPDKPTRQGQSGGSQESRGHDGAQKSDAKEVGKSGHTEIIDEAYLRRRWNLLSTNAPIAWKALRSIKAESPVIVAVIDTGIDTDHPDLRDYIFRKDGVSPRHFKGGEQPDADVRPDNRGLVKLATNKALAHGTHVAGIIVGVANKRFGPNDNVIQLMPLKIHSPSDVNRAIRHATKHAKIIAFTLEYKLDETPAIADAIAEATKANVLFVCAAGNDGKDIDKAPDATFPACFGRKYADSEQRLRNGSFGFRDWPEPANFNVDRIITVGSMFEEPTKPGSMIAERGLRSGFSNYGDDTVDIWAPGGHGELKDEENDLSRHVPDKEILSTIPTSLNTTRWQVTRTTGPRAPYAGLWGTSQATPHVAGAAALLWAHKPDLSPEDIKKLLVQESQRSLNPMPSPIALLTLLQAPQSNESKRRPILDLRFMEHYRFREMPEESSDALSHFSRGTQLFRQRDFRKSLAELSAAISLYPNNPAYYYFTAFSRASLGDWEAATEDLEVALEMEKEKPIENWGMLMERFQGPNRSLVEQVRTSFRNGKPIPPSAQLWAGWDSKDSVQPKQTTKSNEIVKTDDTATPQFQFEYSGNKTDGFRDLQFPSSGVYFLWYPRWYPRCPCFAY